MRIGVDLDGTKVEAVARPAKPRPGVIWDLLETPVVLLKLGAWPGFPGAARPWSPSGPDLLQGGIAR